MGEEEDKKGRIEVEERIEAVEAGDSVSVAVGGSVTYVCRLGVG